MILWGDNFSGVTVCRKTKLENKKAGLPVHGATASLYLEGSAFFLLRKG
jgi:hypothetical protein